MCIPYYTYQRATFQDARGLGRWRGVPIEPANVGAAAADRAQDQQQHLGLKFTINKHQPQDG